MLISKILEFDNNEIISDGYKSNKKSTYFQEK